MIDFVVNLKRRRDRLARFQANYSKAMNIRIENSTITYVEAFDGKNIHPHMNNYDVYTQLFINKCTLKKGEIGCFLSHMSIWKHMIDNQTETALIYEDDVSFDVDYSYFLDKVLNEFPSHGQILYIGGRFLPNHYTYPSKRVSTHLCEHDLTRGWNGKNHDRTTHAYVLSLQGARSLMDAAKKCEKHTVPVDHFMTRHFEKNNIPIFSAYPLLCWSPQHGDTDIQY